MFIVSCSSDDENEPAGLYEEKAPVEQRTKMDFDADKNEVTIHYEDGTFRTFAYGISHQDGVISLVPLGVNDYPSYNYFFYYKDQDNFFIGNIYDTETVQMEFGRPNPDNN